MRRAVIMLTAFLACLMLTFGFGAQSAWAEGEAVQGTLTNDGQPLAGVKITAFTPDGQKVGDATSGADGKWKIPVPAAGPYRVDLDTTTLPAGLAVTSRASLTPTVADGQVRNLLFQIGPAGGDQPGGTSKPNSPAGPSQSDRVWNLIYAGVHFALVIALAALGISLIFGTTGLTNFAHGELVTFGGLMAYLFNITVGLNIFVAAFVSVAIGAGFGYLQDRYFWGWLRKRRAGIIAMMIISIGLSLLLRYVFLYYFGGESRAVDYNTQAGIEIGPITVAPKNLVSDGISITVIVLVALALLMTRMGKATRAVADNPALAAASGINVDRVIRLVWTVGGALAALAGVILAVYQNVGYQMGQQILLLVFAAVTLGGLGTAWGALLGSLVVGLFIQLSTLWIPAEMKTVGALVVLIVILLFRPQGILGRRVRIG